MIPRVAIGLVVLLLAVVPAGAHDYWLQPESFFPEVGKVVALRLHVGDHFASEAERPFQRKPTLKFQVLGAKETHDLNPLGEEGKTPVARITARAPGTHLIRMERAPQLIKLDAEKFNRYLAEEGLDRILAERRQAGQDKAEGRERYSRYLKALIQAGDRSDDTYRRVLGQTLEIVPQANPCDQKVGATLPVLVLFEGKPLAGARLNACHQVDGKAVVRSLTTSDAGLATVKVERSGPWLIRLVHMRRCSDDKEKEADWESFWAALTFGVR